MRQQFSETLEKGRIRAGNFASNAGERHGAFFIRCPKTGERLKIIASCGDDWAIADLPGEPWEHVSVSCERRCPTWDEMAFVKELFFGDEEAVVQFHPPKSAYVSDHPFVLHMWRPTQAALPMPPLQTV